MEFQHGQRSNGPAAVPSRSSATARAKRGSHQRRPHAFVRAAVSCLCAFTLAIQGLSVTGLGAVRAFADSARVAAPAQESASSASVHLEALSADDAQDMFTIQENIVDLNAAWAAQDEGLGAQFQITESGTYQLSDDLTVSYAIVVNAPQAEVTIDLNGHTLSYVADGGSGYAINVKSAAVAHIIGDSPDMSKLKFDCNPITTTIVSSADKLVVSGLSIESVQNDNAMTLASLESHGIHAKRGEVTVEDCSIGVDISNQMGSRANKASLSGCSAAVYLESGVTSASLERVSGTVKGGMNLSVLDGSGVDRSGFAYGVVSSAEGEVSVKDASFDVSAGLGIAVGICGKNVSLELGDEDNSKIVCSLDSAQASYALWSLATGGMKVDAPLQVTYGETDQPAALYSEAENGFVLGGDFNPSQAGVLVNTSSGNNAPDTRIATFKSGVSSTRQTLISAELVNALGVDHPCDIASDGAGLYFRLSTAKAPVKLEHNSSSTWYATVAEAIGNAVSGDTITLLADVGAIDFTPSDTSRSSTYTLDLDGHAAESLFTATAGALKVTNGTIAAVNTESGYAVGFTGSGKLEMTDVNIQALSSSRTVYGLTTNANGSYSASGSFTLTNVNVSCLSTGGAAYGIYQYTALGGAVSCSGGSISVTSESSGDMAYGVYSLSSQTVTLDSCPLVVQGTTGAVVGFYGTASLAVRGDASQPSMQIRALGAPKTVTGINAYGSSQTVTLDTCTIQLSAEGMGTQSGYWCLETQGRAPAIALAGSCDFSSPTDTEMNLGGSKLSLASDFAVAGSAIHVSVAGTEGGVFAQCAGAIADAQALAPLFGTASGSYYEDWTVQAQDDSGTLALALVHAASVRNTTTNTSYQTLSEALAAAADGDTLKLLANCEVQGTLACPASVTLDLAGFTVSQNAGTAARAGSSGHGAAISVDGKRLRITDSEGSGALNIEAAAEGESASGTYQGIAAFDGAELVLDSCAVNVVYAGDSTLTRKPEQTLRGISADGASVSLLNGATLVVRAASTDGAFGPTTAVGIYASVSTGAVSVSGDSSVTVVNNAGSLDVPSSGLYDLAELKLEEGSALYEEIQEQFYLKAKFDASVDTAGYKYGNRVYYAVSLALPSGLTVWAYSDPVSAADAGKKDSVKATHVYVKAPHTVAQSAYGIAADASYAGSVSQSGSVSAQTGKGNAYALYEPEGATWSTVASKLSATCSDEPYNVVTGQFDLQNYINLPMTSSKPVSYVSQNNPDIYYVQKTSSVARPIATVGTVYTTVVDAEVNETYYSMPSVVSLTCVNARAADGSALPSATIDVNYGQTISASGASLPAAQDYTDAGVAYRFIGWRITGQTSVYDTQALEEGVAFGDDMTGASSGSMKLSAIYCAVIEGQQHLITFKNGSTLIAYAVDDGERPSYARCTQLDSVEVPSHLNSESGYSYPFEGWVAGLLATDVYSGQTPCYQAGLPVATADAQYTALYGKKVSKTTLVFSYMQEDLNGGHTSMPSYEYFFDWTRDAIDAANERVELGDTFDESDVRYTFEGWSVRESDVEPMFTDSIPIQYETSGFNTSKSYYGVYSSNAVTADVDFYVNGTLYATATSVDTSSTINAAFLASDNPTIPIRTGYSLGGWNTERGATTYLQGNVKRIADLVSGTNRVSLYSVWVANLSDRPVVTFYDDDRTTVLLRLEMESGKTVYEVYDEAYQPRKTQGKSFKGWVDDGGAAFSTTETRVVHDTDVYAVYYKEGTSSGTATGASAGAAAVANAASGSAGTAAAAAAPAAASARAASAAAAAAAAAPAAAAKAADGSGSGSDSDSTAAAASGASGDDSNGGGGAQDGEGEEGEAGSDLSIDGNAVGFMAFQVALIALIGAGIYWLLGRRSRKKEDDPISVVAPEMDAIRF